MKSITKKRTKAMLIDQAVYNTIIMGAEMLYRKKRPVKSEVMASLVVPTVAMWAAEYWLLKRDGQTIGYKLQGIKLEAENGAPLSSEQIWKRILYRDFVSSIDYYKDKDLFEEADGALLPHDKYTNTIVREV